MKVTPTELRGVLLVEPEVYRDGRGFFLETFRARTYDEYGLPAVFVQDNHSCSLGGTLRGLHAQERHPQGKLVRVVRGEIYDVVVDIRRGSPTFRRWLGVYLSADNFLQCYVPPGFAHGFCVTSDAAEVEYKCTDYYDSTDELRVRWNDPEIGVDWPVREPILSAKDQEAPPLAAIIDRLPVFER